jgi:hypothetical protein
MALRCETFRSGTVLVDADRMNRYVGCAVPAQPLTLDKLDALPSLTEARRWDHFIFVSLP